MSLLRQKVDDIISLLEVSAKEAEQIEQKRLAIENKDIALSQREKRLNDRDIAQTQLSSSLSQQEKYIDEQGKSTQTLLAKIQIEKKELADLIEQRRQIDADKLQLEADKKMLEGLVLEKQRFQEEKTAFDREKDLFIQEKKAHHEAQAQFAIREKNIKSKEDRLDTIERLTQV